MHLAADSHRYCCTRKALQITTATGRAIPSELNSNSALGIESFHAALYLSPLCTFFFTYHFQTRATDFVNQFQKETPLKKKLSTSGTNPTVKNTTSANWRLLQPSPLLALAAVGDIQHSLSPHRAAGCSTSLVLVYYNELILVARSPWQMPGITSRSLSRAVEHADPASPMHSSVITLLASHRVTQAGAFSQSQPEKKRSWFLS